MKDDRRSVFRDAPTDIRTSRAVPDTPQTRAPSYRLAFNDDAFLCRDELRPVRLQLELLKPEMLLGKTISLEASIPALMAMDRYESQGITIIDPALD